MSETRFCYHLVLSDSHASTDEYPQCKPPCRTLTSQCLQGHKTHRVVCHQVLCRVWTQMDQSLTLVESQLSVEHKLRRGSWCVQPGTSQWSMTQATSKPFLLHQSHDRVEKSIVIHYVKSSTQIQGCQQHTLSLINRSQDILQYFHKCKFCWVVSFISRLVDFMKIVICHMCIYLWYSLNQLSNIANVRHWSEVLEFWTSRLFFLWKSHTGAIFREFSITSQARDLFTIIHRAGSRIGSVAFRRNVGMGSNLHDFEFPPIMTFFRLSSLIGENALKWGGCSCDCTSLTSYAVLELLNSSLIVCILSEK